MITIDYLSSWLSCVSIYVCLVGNSSLDTGVSVAWILAKRANAFASLEKKRTDKREEINKKS